MKSLRLPYTGIVISFLVDSALHATTEVMSPAPVQTHSLTPTASLKNYGLCESSPFFADEERINALVGYSTQRQALADLRLSESIFINAALADYRAALPVA